MVLVCKVTHLVDIHIRCDDAYKIVVLTTPGEKVSEYCCLSGLVS